MAVGGFGGIGGGGGFGGEASSGQLNKYLTYKPLPFNMGAGPRDPETPKGAQDPSATLRFTPRVGAARIQIGPAAPKPTRMPPLFASAMMDQYGGPIKSRGY